MNNLTHNCTRLSAALLLSASAISSYADVAPITTQGNKVLFGGQVGSIAGNSLFWSNTGWGGEKYYTAGTVNWLKSDWNAGLVRAAMGADDNGGYLTDASNKAKVKTVVDAAIANDIYVIIDWHSHHAEDYRAEAIAFFKEMATTYGTNHHVIYEIYNEPLNLNWNTVLKPYAEAVIAEIRAIDPDNLIIVGTPNWSQDVDIAANNPITGYANIAYTLHFYAGTHKQSLRNKAQAALNKGIPLFVTEWGSVEASGDGAVAISETNAWMDFLRSNHISHANWALNDKVEGASALVAGASPTGGWVSSQLTASGALTKDYILNWPALPATSTSSTSSAGASANSAGASASAASMPSSAVASSIALSSTAASSLAPSSSAAALSSAAPASSTAASPPKSSGGGSSALWLLMVLLHFALRRQQ
jgi:endoglucanase